jgi:hypothetical protein
MIIDTKVCMVCNYLRIMGAVIIGAAMTIWPASHDRLPEVRLDVGVFDKTRSASLNQVRVGDSVVLRITPQKATGEAFVNVLKPVIVTLASGNSLLSTEEPQVEPDYRSGINGPTDRYVIFTKIPFGNQEIVRAWGKWHDPIANRTVPILGEAGIRVLPGSAYKVVFLNPSSVSKGLPPPILAPGVIYPCTLAVEDKYGNRVKEAASVFILCRTPDIALISGSLIEETIATDSTGLGVFTMQATDNASAYDTVRVSAMLSSEKDKIVVGKIKTAPCAKAEFVLKRNPVFKQVLPALRMVACFDLQGRRTTKDEYSKGFPGNSINTPMIKKGRLARKIYLTGVSTER